MDGTSFEFAILPRTLFFTLLFIGFAANMTAFLVSMVENQLHFAVSAHIIGGIAMMIVIVSLAVDGPMSTFGYIGNTVGIGFLAYLTVSLFSGIKGVLEKQAAEVAARDRADMRFN